MTRTGRPGADAPPAAVPLRPARGLRRELPAFHTLEHDTRAALASLHVPLHPEET